MEGDARFVIRGQSVLGHATPPRTPAGRGPLLMVLARTMNAGAGHQKMTAGRVRERVSCR